MRSATASLSPESFQHEIIERPGFQICQVDHGFQIRSVTELHVPCACGRPLCGIETDWIADERGHALYFKGVCLSCGVQHGLYMGTPAVENADNFKARHDAQLKADVTAVLERVQELRDAAEPTPETAEDRLHRLQMEAA